MADETTGREREQRDAESTRGEDSGRQGSARDAATRRAEGTRGDESTSGVTDDAVQRDRAAQSPRVDRMQEEGEGIHGVGTDGRGGQRAEEEIRKSAEGE